MDFTETRKLVNPRAKANFVSKLFFWWIFPLFKKGARVDLTPDDFFSVLGEDESGTLGSELAGIWEQECTLAQKRNKQPKFYTAMIKMYWKRYAVLGLYLMILEWIIRVGQTLLLQMLIAAVADKESSRRDQFLLGTGIVLSTFVYAIFLHAIIFAITHLGMKCRVACSSLIYRKAMRISRAAQNQTTVGQLVNLLSNDVGRCDSNVVFLHYLIIAPVQAAILMYFLWTIGDVGVACLAGVGFVLFLIPIQYYIGKLTVIFRYQIAKRTDVRGQIMNEIIVAMRLIKMYVWEHPFSSLVNRTRKMEVNFLRKTAYLRAFYVSLYTSGSRVMMCLTVLTIVLRGGELKADQVFFALSIYNILQLMMVQFIPTAAAHWGELVVSLNRIETFLVLDEKKPTDSLQIYTPNSSASFDKQKEPTIMAPSVVMTGASASWTGAKPNLDKLTLNIRGDRVVMVIGPVGSGKTSLLHALIGELPLATGRCVINGQTAYASQEPWIFSGNLRQNILFGKNYEDTLYRQVIHASALEDDLKQLPFGENTIVGDRGIALSGGQKARVNLARALYQQADIYLLDDPLSAVDARVSRHIFEKCVKGGFLKGKLRILVTHQLQYLSQADHVIVLNSGSILAQGTYIELVNRGIDFVSLMASGEEEETSKRKESVVKANVDDGKVTLASKEEDEKPEIMTEKLAGGSVTGRTYLEYFQSGKSLLGMFLLLIGFILAQLLASAADYWLSYWTGKDENEVCDESNLNKTTEAVVLETYNDHRSSCDPNDGLDDDLYLYIYAGLVGLFFVVSKGRAIYFFQYCMNISINVHNKMFASVVRAPAKFFDDNPSGRIINRFTKDLGSIDELLPPAFFDSFIILLQTLGTLGVVVASNYFMSVPALLLVVLLVFIRRFFLHTARPVKRIEAITRSPVYTHVVATVQGLTTIRASKSEPILIKQFDGHQDLHSSTWFIFLSANRWFGVWLELVSILFLTVVTYSFLLLDDWFGSAQVGLAISSVLSLTGMFQFGMRQSVEVENHMTSVERVLEYSKLESEASLVTMAPHKKPSDDWPLEGHIKFHDVSLAYDLEAPNVLKNLTFEIKGKEKIGIVGRTGAGKSSIIAALFRMTEPNGDIFIDKIRINDIGLHDLRQKISIIPQDPILFSGTVRYNLDPFDQFLDDQLWTVIEEVELKDAVPALDFKVDDGGSNFSLGQRQLVCLARAILRKNKILVLDEATANVDPRTDNLIQMTIRAKFAHCTIITIAHRLHSVMDCDKILVLDHGEVKEYDHPHILLENGEGALTSMVNETGSASTRMLRKIARETHFGRRASFMSSNVGLLTRARTVSTNAGDNERCLEDHNELDEMYHDEDEDGAGQISESSSH